LAKRAKKQKQISKLMSYFGGRDTFGWILFRFKLDIKLQKKRNKKAILDKEKKERKEKVKTTKKTNISK
jgi:hypothetical protein